MAHRDAHEEIVETNSPADSRPALGDRPPLSEEIASHLRELIMSGSLRGGQQVNIESLARDLKTSPTPIREALQALRGEGFVQVEPRRGYHISPLSRRDIEDMFLVQGLVSGELAARAAEAADEEFIQEIIETQHQLEQTDVLADGDKIQQLNFQFHRLINLKESSPKLSWFLSVLNRYVPRILWSTIDDWHRESVGGHQAIIEAIRTNNPAGAREAMRVHIERAGTLLTSYLEKQGFWEEPDEN